MSISDDRFLFALYESTRATEMALVLWSDDQKRDFLKGQFEAQRTDYVTRFPDAKHSIVIADDEHIGRIWIDRRAGEIRLLDIAILPRWQNAGVGTALVEQLQQQATEAGLPLRHSVHTTNRDALRFYQRLDFVVVEDFETHVLMEWNPGVSPTDG
ncbi:MAG: GNAT family N-acetyltransferase [Actinomycetia bacterium]|nr:GNAT family N-acetyltransferase [Actinomycetes bacterium]